MALVETHPQEAHRLCSLLEGDAFRRCQKISERPHLWSEKKITTGSDVKKIAKEQTTCRPGSMFRTCIDSEIATVLRTGNVDQAKGLCANISEEKWRFECLFGAAEQVTKHRGTHGYSQGVDLCLDAGTYVDNCLNHLIMILAKKAPSAHSSQAQDWLPIFSASNAVRAAWSWRDREKMEFNQERLWSEALGMSYSGIKPVTGNPYDLLENKLAVHIHSGLTRRLLQIDPPKTYKLGTWVELAERCLQERAPDIKGKDVVSRFQAAADLWDKTETLPSTAYMATSRRLFSTDPHIDIHIAILEAAARIPPAYRPLLEEGLSHKNLLVQKTAQRLLSQIDIAESKGKD